MSDHPYDEAYTLPPCQIPQTQNHASCPLPGFGGVLAGLGLLGFGLVGFVGLAGFRGDLIGFGLLGRRGKI